MSSARMAQSAYSGVCLIAPLHAEPQADQEQLRSPIPASAAQVPGCPAAQVCGGQSFTGSIHRCDKMAATAMRAHAGQNCMCM